MTTFIGGCLCGAVRYECTAEPIAMLNCHCRDCQHVTGGPYAAAILLPAKAFTLTKGKLRHHLQPRAKGGQHKRGFCADCGSRVTGGESEGPSDMIGICRNAGRSALVPANHGHFYGRRSAVGFHGLTECQVHSIPASVEAVLLQHRVFTPPRSRPRQVVQLLGAGSVVFFQERTSQCHRAEDRDQFSTTRRERRKRPSISSEASCQLPSPVRWMLSSPAIWASWPDKLATSVALSGVKRRSRASRKNDVASRSSLRVWR